MKCLPLLAALAFCATCAIARAQNIPTGYNGYFNSYTGRVDPAPTNNPLTGSSPLSNSTFNPYTGRSTIPPPFNPYVGPVGVYGVPYNPYMGAAINYARYRRDTGP